MLISLVDSISFQYKKCQKGINNKITNVMMTFVMPDVFTSQSTPSLFQKKNRQSWDKWILKLLFCVDKRF
jgi:hypothetical protein